MKTLYLDCGMGAAGDMLTAALWELLPDREGFLKQLNALGLPGVTVSARPSVKCGVTGTHFEVLVDGEAEEEHARRRAGAASRRSTPTTANTAITTTPTGAWRRSGRSWTRSRFPPP
jgi:uncharacterized protein (DUF111 family)